MSLDDVVPAGFRRGFVFVTADEADELLAAVDLRPSFERAVRRRPPTGEPEEVLRVPHWVVEAARPQDGGRRRTSLRRNTPLAAAMVERVPSERSEPEGRSGAAKSGGGVTQEA